MRVKLCGALVLLFFLALTAKACAQSSVFIEFFYFDPSRFCPTCDPSAQEEYIAAVLLIGEIRSDYKDQVQVEQVDRTTAEGRERFSQYGLTELQAVVVNHKIKLEGAQLTEDNLRRYIDAYLRGEDPTSGTFQQVSALFAFSIGLFSSLSPCLMATLAFILSYASGTVSSFKSGMLRVSIFGIGFISALFLIGALLAAVLLWTPFLATIMTWVVTALMIIIGLNLVGLLPVPSGLRSFGQKLGSRGRIELAHRYRATAIGLFSLGFMFYFVNLCAAPLSFTVLPTLTAPSNIYLLPLFGVGAIIPFLVVGLVAGGSPALARRIGLQHRLKIRALSGAILLAYSIWLIGFNLLSSKIAFAYSLVMGFFPSLLAMFVFILVYSAGTSGGLREGLGKTTAFALGLVTAIVLTSMSWSLVGGTFIFFLFDQLHARYSPIVILVALVLILVGLNLTGILGRLTRSESLLHRLIQNHTFTIVGLFFLGSLVFFVAFGVFPITAFFARDASIDVYLLLAFNLVLLIPFLVVGIISGGFPRLMMLTHRTYRLEMRAFSGMILIAYAVWLLLQQII